ncbi:MAG: chloride channel protein [Candidatus Micrarchaeaceae archaeon]
MNKLRDMEYFEKWLILGILIGIAAGIGATIFYFAIKLVESFFLGNVLGMNIPLPIGETATQTNYTFSVANYLLIPLVLIIGGAISGFIVYKFAPEAEGHGTDAAISSFHNKDGKIKPHVPLVKTIASAITIGSGGSAGREGPTAQIAAGIGSYLVDFFRLSDADRRTAVVVGIGSGVGTIFKAPIGGAIFAIEVPYKRDFETSAIFPAIVASAIGYSIFGSIVGFTPIFGFITNTFNPLRLPFYAILGLIAGFLAVFYIWFFYKIHDGFKKLKISNFYKPIIGAGVAGIIALLFPEVMAVGYGWIQLLINNNALAIPTFGLPLILILVMLPIAKIIATSFTVGSGGSGGVFAPGIFIGASLGFVYALILHSLLPVLFPSVAPLVIIGMLAFFGAAGKVPISVLLMVIEMTGSLQLLPAAMLAVSFSYLTSRNGTIYRSQVLSREFSPIHLNEYKKPIMLSMEVGTIPLRDISVNRKTSQKKVISLMQSLNVSYLPIVEKGIYLGSITASELAKNGMPNSNLWIDRNSKSLDPSDNIAKALNLMAKINVLTLPVEKDGRYLGNIFLYDIMKAYDLRAKAYTKDI